MTLEPPSATGNDAPQEASGTRSGRDEAWSLLDKVNAGVARIAPDGSIVEINRHGQHLMSLTSFVPGEVNVRGFEPYTVWLDGSPCRYEDYPPIKCMRTGKPHDGCVLGVKMPSGEILWMTVTAEPLFSSSGEVEGSIVTVLDNRGPQNIEQSLRLSEERYRRLIENAPDAILVHQQGRIVFINDAGVKLWGGRGPRDFLGRNVLDLIDPRDRETARLRMQRVVTEGKTPLIRQRHIRLDGRKIQVEVTGTACVYDGVPSVQVVFRDVTKRRRIGRRLRRQRETLEVFFTKIPVLVGIYSPGGRAKAINEEWKRIIGWGEELTLAELLERMYPDEAKRAGAIEFITSGDPGWRDFDVRVREGETRQMSWANIQLSNGDIIGMALDITDRRRVADELRTAKAELEERVEERTIELTRANKELKRKQHLTEMALSVHERDRKLVAYEIHDVILQEVIGALMYIDSIHDQDAAMSTASVEALDQARKLLRKCIDGARQMISGLRPPIIDEQGVAGAIDFLVSEFEGRGMQIQFTHSVPQERLAAELETAIFRIVQEALTNVERHSRAQEAEVDIRLRDDKIHVTVRDHGVGFDAQEVPHGHFGLEGIRERAHLVGGRAEFEASPGKGTIVRVEIPVRFAPAEDE
jgi:PAS domain S-box-containing protein